MSLTRTSCTVAATLMIVAATAAAGPLRVDPNGLPGYTGNVYFNADDRLHVELDYAVFAPSVYPLTGDPSDGDQYVYAYQAFNISAAQGLTAVTIGLLEDSGAGNMAADATYAALGGVMPTMFSLHDSSAVFRFLAPQVPAGGHSTVFLFTSPNPPTYAAASVSGGGYSDQLIAPSPIPEPTTCLPLVVGGLLVLSRRGVWC
jgi:hypothetical protein